MIASLKDIWKLFHEKLNIFGIFSITKNVLTHLLFYNYLRTLWLKDRWNTSVLFYLNVPDWHSLNYISINKNTFEMYKHAFRVNQATTKMLPHLGNSSIDTCLQGCNSQYDVRIGRTITRIKKPGYIMTSALVFKEKKKKAKLSSKL